MKILLFMDNPSIQTGYASTCRLTAKELTARGHQVYAMGFNSGPVGDSIVDWYDLKIVPNYAIARDGNAIYGDYECLKRAFEEVQPDVMLFHNDSYRYSYLKQMTPEMQERSVFWLPFEGDYPDKLGNEIFSKIAATRFVTQHALNVNAPELKGKDLGVIYHAIEMGEANRPYPKEEAKRRHVQPRIDKMGIKKDAAKLFVVSRVDRHQPRKYWDLTIEAFAKFAKGKDDVVLLAKCNPRDCTMWDDPKKEGIDLEAMAKKLGVDVCFDDFFFNPQSLHQSFYWPADVFITTTSGEGFGLCAAEAMSNGVPVIAPNVPVLPEVVGDGGMFCKIKEKVWYDKMSVFHNIVDVDDVAAKLEVAYQDWKAGGPNLADLGAKARALAESRYDPKVVYDKWDQVFKDVKERGELSTIITVIYNVTGKDQLFGDDGIDKLRQTMEDNVKYPYEWIIVDNGSPAREETREWLEKAAKNNPRIKPLLLDDNYGFAGANNRAIALAKGKTVVLVNPDSEAIPPAKHGLVKDWLQIYVERANSDESIGVIGMKLNQRDDILPGAIFPYFACVLLSRKCLDAIKLSDGKWFDEAFWPAYYEDSLDGKRCVPIKIKNKIDVIPLEKLFTMGKIRMRPDGKEEAILHDVKTLSVNQQNPCGVIDIENLPEWWINRFLSAAEKKIYLLYKQTKNWRKAARMAGFKTRSETGFLSNRIRKRICRSMGEEATGQWSRVCKVIRHKVVKPMSMVTTKHGQTECTNDHSLMVWDGTVLRECRPTEIMDTKPCSITRISNSEHEVDSSCIIPLDVQNAVVEGNMASFGSRGYQFPIRIDYGDVEKSKAFFGLIGDYVSEGSVCKNCVSICGTNRDYMDVTFRDFKTVLGRKPNFSRYKTTDSGIVRGKRIIRKAPWYYRVSSVNKQISAAFEAMCGKGSHNKRIPSFVFTAPRELQEVFLSRLFRGDAYCFNKGFSKYEALYSAEYKDKAFRFGTVSLDLVSGLCLLLSMMDIRFSTSYDDLKKCYGVDYVMFRKNSRLSPIKVAERIHDGFVYDLEVEGNHTFVDAMGLIVVHNTDYCWRALGKGFKVVDNDTPFWHKSGGTNKYAIEGGPGGKVVPYLKASLDRMSVSNAGMADWSRKKLELEKDGMQGLIDGNIKYLQSKWGESARKKIRVVWQTHIGEAVGFSELAEGLIPELHRLGFDVYVNDWSNGAKITNPIIKELWEKTRRAKEQGDDLYDSINIVCWLMETFLGVEAGYKVGISLCESTKVRESYLQACNSMDRILTFSEFCKRVQLDSGFKSPIHVIPPGVDPIYINLAKRQLKKDKYTFLAVGVSQDRKDTRRLVSAFCEAFPKDSPFVPEVPSCPIKPNQVELVIKSNNFGELEWISKPGPNGEPPFDQRANIRAIFTGWDQRAKQPDFSKKEMYDLYASADCMIQPSHGEGIGMPHLEGAGTGLPLIFTNWSSPAEYFNEENSYPCSLSPYPGTTFTQAYPGAPGDNGQWANVHCGHLKFLMYHVLQNLEEAFKKGEKAHEHVKSKYNWKNSAAALAPLLFEWDADRRNKEARNEFDPLTFVKPPLDPVMPGDRIMIDVVTRDRRPYLAVLICSLLHQTFKNWDMIIEIDDADENVLHDHLVMSLLARARLEGHEWRMIRSHRQGPHMAHDRTLFMTHENPERKYKLICRIDDDIYVEPTYLEKLFEPFVADKDCEIAAVGGVYPDPKRPKDTRGTDKGQMAPPGFEQDINYGGKIDHNVPWPYVCYYPEGTKPRLVEHLYSSFLFRVELGVAIGGYCKLFSAIGHREESDFSYRFYLAGYKLFIHPEAIGYHFQAPAGGIRSGDIGENKNELASGDHKIYERRLAKWKKRAAMRVVAAPKPPVPPETEQVKNANEEPKKPAPRMIAVINGGPDVTVLQDAVTRTAEFADEIYVTTPNPLCRAKLKNEKLRMISCSTEETTALSLALAKTTDFVMTIKDTHRFLGNPRALLVDWIEDYAFEVYQTYDKDGRTFIGPELRNECLVSRRNKNDGQKPVDVSKVKYTDIMVLDEAKLDGLSGKSLNGLVLIPLDKTDKMSWTKVCVYQFPEGELKPPRAATYEPEIKDIVSIIIPTNNRLGMLRKCIDSIYSHTSTPFEIVVVDNGSTDGTREYLEKESVKRPAVRYTRNATNLGYQKAANMGVSLSRGKHVLLFNDDAWVDGDEPDGRDWLSTYVDELEGDPKLGLVGPHAPNGGLSPTLKKPMLFFWCVMTRREIWDEVGQLDDVMFYNYGGDDDWCERLRQKGYSIKVKKANLRHLMSLVPETIKNKELEESRAKLLAKYHP